jgi:hypothetical protein
VTSPVMRSLAGCLYDRACPASRGSLRIAGDAVLINGLSERIVADMLSVCMVCRTIKSERYENVISTRPTRPRSG